MAFLVGVSPWNPVMSENTLCVFLGHSFIYFDFSNQYLKIALYFITWKKYFSRCSKESKPCFYPIRILKLLMWYMRKCFVTAVKCRGEWSSGEKLTRISELFLYWRISTLKFFDGDTIDVNGKYLKSREQERD